MSPKASSPSQWSRIVVTVVPRYKQQSGYQQRHLYSLLFPPFQPAIYLSLLFVVAASTSAATRLPPTIRGQSVVVCLAQSSLSPEFVASAAERRVNNHSRLIHLETRLSQLHSSEPLAGFRFRWIQLLKLAVQHTNQQHNQSSHGLPKPRKSYPWPSRSVSSIVAAHE